jgi:hypothetical protein
MYRSFEREVMIRLVFRADEPEPKITGVERYTLRTVTSLQDLVEKVRIFDAGLNDAIVELSKLSMAAWSYALYDAYLQFQTIDDRGDLTFAAIGQQLTPQLLTIPRSVYDENYGKRFYDLVAASEQKGTWLLIDTAAVKRFSSATPP